MKRFLCLGAFVAVALTANATFAADECAKITATGHPQYPAIAYKDGDNIAGAAPMLVEAIAKDLKVPLESKFMGMSSYCPWRWHSGASREVAEQLIGVDHMQAGALEDADGLVRVLKAEDQDRLVRAAEREGVHVFDVEPGALQHLEHLGEPAGTVGHLDGDHLGDVDDAAGRLQHLLGLLPLPHDQAQDAELLRYRPGTG